MKKILIFVMFLSLYSCHKTKNDDKSSVMQDKKSLINLWYGENHFNNTPSDQGDDITSDLNEEPFSATPPATSTPASQASTPPPSSAQTSELMRRPEDSLLDAFDQALNLEN